MMNNGKQLQSCGVLLELAQLPVTERGRSGVREADLRARQRKVTFSCYFRGFPLAEGGSQRMVVSSEQELRFICFHKV